jgi:hypothetical protein
VGDYVKLTLGAPDPIDEGTAAANRSTIVANSAGRERNGEWSVSRVRTVSIPAARSIDRCTATGTARSRRR